MGKEYILVFMPGSECSIWASTKKHLELNNPNRKLNMKQEEPTSFLKGLYAKGCCRYKKIRICGGLETCPAGYFCPFINLACALLDMKQRWRPVNDTWASSARTPLPAIIWLNNNWQDHLDEMISGVFSWKGTEKSLGSQEQGVRTSELILALTRVALLVC